MARWLVTKRRRDRDIRDFVIVHGKILKPDQQENDDFLNASLPADVVRTGGRRTKQATLPRLHSSWSRKERERERELKAPASRFSKGVRRKGLTLVIEDGGEGRAKEGEKDGQEVGNPHCERTPTVADKENTSGGQSLATAVGPCQKVKTAISERLPLSLVKQKHTTCAPVCRRRKRGGREDTHSPTPLAKRSAPSISMEISPNPSTPRLPLSQPEMAASRAAPDNREEVAVMVEWRERRREKREEEVGGVDRTQSVVSCVPEESGGRGLSVSPALRHSLVLGSRRGEHARDGDEVVGHPSQASEGEALEWGSSNTSYSTGSSPSCLTSWDTERLLAELSSCEKLE